MQKIYYILAGLLAVVGLASCSSDEAEMASTDTYQLNFQVINYEQIALKSNMRATTRAQEPHFVMAIYDAQTNKLVEEPTIHKSGSAEGGTFSARLTAGEYNIVFLAYPTDRTLVADDPTAITWDARVVGSTFLKTLNITVDENTNAQQEIVLSRAVGMFTLNCTGTAVPGNFDHFRIQMTGGSYQLNALTGLAGADVTRDYAFASQKSAAGKTDVSQSGYAFLPQEACNVDITMIAEDADNQPIRKRTFTAVPMKINQNTRYTGDFFNETSNNGFSLKIDEKEWENVDFDF